MDWSSLTCPRTSPGVEYPLAFWIAVSAAGAAVLGIVLDRRVTGMLLAVSLGGVAFMRIRTQSRSSSTPRTRC